MAGKHDARAVVGRFAEMRAAIRQRIWRLIELARAAADTDEAMARLLAQGAANRRADCRDFAEHAVAAGLRPDLTPSGTAGVLWLYASAEVYRMLVGTAGWTTSAIRPGWLAPWLIRCWQIPSAVLLPGRLWPVRAAPAGRAPTGGGRRGERIEALCSRVDDDSPGRLREA